MIYNRLLSAIHANRSFLQVKFNYTTMKMKRMEKYFQNPFLSADKLQVVKKEF